MIILHGAKSLRLQKYCGCRVQLCHLVTVVYMCHLFWHRPQSHVIALILWISPKTFQIMHSVIVSRVFFVSGCCFKFFTTPSRIRCPRKLSTERTDLFSTSDSQWPHPQARTPRHLYPIPNPNPLGCRTCNHQFKGPHLAWRYDSAEVWSPTHSPNDLILRTA